MAVNIHAVQMGYCRNQCKLKFVKMGALHVSIHGITNDIMSKFQSTKVTDFAIRCIITLFVDHSNVQFSSVQCRYKHKPKMKVHGDLVVSRFGI